MLNNQFPNVYKYINMIVIFNFFHSGALCGSPGWPPALGCQVCDFMTLSILDFFLKK